ncbi:Endonuclease III-like protein 1 [Trapelia coarctata]|nr:Endonuclease III-like protein 1 [Trapelia coarctata]
MDLDTGKAVVEGLAALPTLKECTLRLGRQPNDDLRALAQRGSKSMTNSFSESGFPYESLPEELRVRILSFTHLGSRGSYHDRYKLLRIERNRLVKGNLKYIHRPTCCSRCTETFADCCCPTTHASYSKSCECRLIRPELFLVGKTVYKDALRVLYSENCFDILQDPQETVLFLSRLPPGALKFIRRIQFRFSERQVRGWKRNGLTQQWNSLVAFIQQNLNLSNLLIVVNLQAVADICLWNDEDEDAGNRFVYDVYFQLANGLCSLPGLCDLHFVLGWFADLEPVLEKKVMGEAYDSMKGNKTPKVPSSATCSDCLKFSSRARCRACRIPSWHH